MRISDWSSDVCSSDLPVKAKKPTNRAGSRAFPGEGEGVMPRCGKPAPLEQIRVGWNRFQRSDLGALAQGRGGLEVDRDELADAAPGHGDAEQAVRWDEHTSELQSLMRHSYAAFCL